MRHNKIRSLILAGTAAILVAGRAIPAHSAELSDDAGFFSRKALDRANSELAALRREYGKDVRIETFDSVPAGKSEEVTKMDRTERARFFDKWARDRATAERVKGIYILICRHPGHVQIEVDRQTRNQGFGDSERNEVRDILLAGFKHKDYDKALLDAVENIRETMKKKLTPHAEAVGSPGAPRHRVDQYTEEPAGRAPARGMGWLGWIIVALVVFLGIRLIAALFTGLTGGGRPGGYGYGPGYGGGGGGFLSNMMGGLFGAVAGNWLYNSFFGPSVNAGQSGGFGAGQTGERNVDSGAGEDFQGSGGDFDDRDDMSGGGDFGGSNGGGDFGNGGGGDFGGGDFGGGDSGGGDF